MPVSLRRDREEMEDGGGSYVGWGLILPAGEVYMATQRAKEVAQQDDAEDAPSPAEPD